LTDASHPALSGRGNLAELDSSCRITSAGR
jgi:hypothetical protein